MSFSLDTETTGLDFDHGVRPFFVTVCYEDGYQQYWEWPVNPLNRQPIIPPGDIKQIQTLLDVAGGWAQDFDAEVAERHTIILQNGKFDITALASVGITNWPFSQTRDTQLAAHLLDSDQFQNLTDLCTRYLGPIGADMLELEKSLHEAVKESRRLVQHAKLEKERYLKKDQTLKATQVRMADWDIARDDHPGLPSQGGKIWAADYWLPRAVAKELDYPVPVVGCEHEWDKDSKCGLCGGHHWWIVLSIYGNSDTAATIALWPVMKAQIVKRGLWKIYLEMCKQIEAAYRMERRGLTKIDAHMDYLEEDYRARAKANHTSCVAIARSKGYELEMGESGSTSDSLRQFLLGRFDVERDEEGITVHGKNGQPIKDKLRYVDSPDCLNLPKLALTDKGGVSLDKDVMEEYGVLYPPSSATKEAVFIDKLVWMRKFGTAVGYIDSYRRYATPGPAPGYTLLRPSTRLTGTAHLRTGQENPNGQQISKKETECPACKGETPDVETCPRCGGTGVRFKSTRYGFGPGPGRTYYSLDYSNVERRIPAAKAGEEEIMALLERPKDPPYYGSEHLMVAHILHKEKFEACIGEDGKVDGRVFKKKYASTLYQRVKNGNFALQYSCGEAKADWTFDVPGAYQMIKGRFWRQEKLNQEQIAHANRYGYIVTLPDATVDPEHGYPIVTPRDKYGKIKPTRPLNYFSSGTACWIARCALVRCTKLLDEWRSQDGFDGAAVLFVHDEIVFDFPKATTEAEEKDNYRRIMEIREVMEEGGTNLVFKIRTPVNIEHHPVSWDKGISVR